MNHIGMLSKLTAFILSLTSMRADVVGFYFLEGAKNYRPENDLLEFLEAGPPPMYIGFGSVVVEDAQAMTGVLHVPDPRVMYRFTEGFGLQLRYLRPSSRAGFVQ